MPPNNRMENIHMIKLKMSVDHFFLKCTVKCNLIKCMLPSLSLSTCLQVPKHMLSSDGYKKMLMQDISSRTTLECHSHCFILASSGIQDTRA